MRFVLYFPPLNSLLWSRPEYVIRYLTASSMYGLHEMEQGWVKLSQGMVEEDCLSLRLYMCRCKEWLNINLVRSYNTALLKEMRYVYLVSQTVLPLSYVCTHTLTRGKGLALWGTETTQYQSRWPALHFLALHFLALHTASKKREGLCCITLPSLYINKQWNVL